MNCFREMIIVLSDNLELMFIDLLQFIWLDEKNFVAKMPCNLYFNHPECILMQACSSTSLLFCLNQLLGWGWQNLVSMLAVVEPDRVDIFILACQYS